MQWFALYLLINSIFLQSNAVFMNGFQSIIMGLEDSIILYCHEAINETEISEINWFRSENNHLIELDVKKNSFHFENITENTLIICQYTYYNYKYWFEIFLLTKEPSICPKSEHKEITKDQTDYYSIEHSSRISAEQTKPNTMKRLASKQPILSSGEMRTAVNFVLNIFIICLKCFLTF